MVDPCGYGHITVRSCGARAAKCNVCALLDKYEHKSASATAERAQREAELVERAARAAAHAAMGAAAAASREQEGEGGNTIICIDFNA